MVNSLGWICYGYLAIMEGVSVCMDVCMYCGSRPPGRRGKESFPLRPLEGAHDGQGPALALWPVGGVKEAQPAGRLIGKIGGTWAWLRELHGSQLTPGRCKINRSVLECKGLVERLEELVERLVELVVVDVERYLEREVEVQEVKWKVQVVEVAEVEVEGGVREGEEGRLLCAWIGRRKVGCVPEPLNVREPCPCIDPRLPDYPVPAYALDPYPDDPFGLRTLHPPY